MVANQSTGPVRDHKGLSAALTKLKVDSKDKKRVSNLSEWKESIQNAFVTHNLTGLLREEFGKQVPPDKVGSILINEEVDAKLDQLRKKHMAKAKEEKLLNEVTSVVKVEGKYDGDPEGTPATAVAMLTTHWPKIEAMVRRNAKIMHEADMKKRASAEKLGEHWEVLYVDPSTLG